MVFSQNLWENVLYRALIYNFAAGDQNDLVSQPNDSLLMGDEIMEAGESR